MKNIFSLIIFFFIGTTITFACSCKEVSVKKALRNSEYAFVGKVKSIVKHDFVDSTSVSNGKVNYFKYTLYDFKFQIIETYKGKSKTGFITLTTTGTEDDCGGYYAENETYLIYAYTIDTNPYFEKWLKIKPYLTTDICIGSEVFSKVNSRRLRKLRQIGKRNK